jgi:heptosyltransferase II
VKILIIDLDNVGDVVMASFLPRALKNMYPDSYIGVLVKEYSRDILKNDPFVNELIIFNPPWLGDLLDKRFSWRETRNLIKKLKTARFDLAIIVNSDWRKALLAKLAGVPERVGADKKKASLFLTMPVAYHDDPGKHTVLDNLDLLKALGYQKNEVNLEVFVDDDTLHWAEQMLTKNNLGKGELLVGIHPGAGHPARIWPSQNYLKLINELQSIPNIKVLLLGAKQDQVIRTIENKIDKDKIIFMQDISVLQMAALFKKCACVIAQDSGPMHLATAVGTKTIAIFGPSSPHKFGPFGPGHIVVRKEMSCSPCGSDPDCQRLDCINNIAVHDVMEQIKEDL